MNWLMQRYPVAADFCFYKVALIGKVVSGCAVKGMPKRTLFSFQMDLVDATDTIYKKRFGEIKGNMVKSQLRLDQNSEFTSLTNFSVCHSMGSHILPIFWQ